MGEPVIVTGLRGLVGSRLTAQPGAPDLISADVADGVDLLREGDLKRLIEAHPEARALIHLAAFTDVSAAYREREDTAGPCYRLNVEATARVARLCREAGLFMVHVSTDFVFDGSKDGPYTEDDAPNPIEWYGRTKWLAEQAVRESGADAATVRIAFPYVAPPAPRPDLIRTFLERLEAGQPMRLFTDQVITPTWGGDIAAGLLALAAARPAGALFHLVGAESLSPHAIGLRVAERFGLEPGLIEASRLGDYLKTDPRPRQARLAIDSARWRDWAARHGLGAPLGLTAGLDRLAQGRPGRGEAPAGR